MTLLANDVERDLGDHRTCVEILAEFMNHGTIAAADSVKLTALDCEE
jgi:hypothetical protein